MATPGSASTFGAYQRRAHPTFRHRHEAGAVMQTDYAGQTVEVIDPKTGEIRQAQIFVAVLGASSLTFAMRELQSATARLDHDPPSPARCRNHDENARALRRVPR